MAVVLTGANGFVGSRVACVLSARGIEVLPFTRGVSPVPLLQRANVLIHLAARVHVMDERSPFPLLEFRQVNVVATSGLARQAAAAGVKRFIFMSSVKVNGEATALGCPFTELDHANPNDAYGVSKWEAEQALRQIALETGMELVIIRPPLVYGPGVKANFAKLMLAVLNRWPLPFGAIKNLRSLVGLDNLADFIHLCIVHPAAANQTFLVSDGRDVSSAELVREMALAAGVRPNVWDVSPRLLQLAAALLGKRTAAQRLCSSLQVDISKARRVLGWQPAVSMQEGLKQAFLKV